MTQSVLDYARGDREPKQSLWGFASLTSAIVAAALMAAIVLAIRVWGRPGAPGSAEAYKLLMLVGGVIPLSLSVLVGLVTGVAGCVQRKRLRKMACAGLGLSLILFLILVNMT